MSIIKPYVYWIVYKPTKQKYVGARWRNIILKLLAEDDFWKIYFTSSKIIENLIKETGIGSFELKWIKEFDTVAEVQNYEHDILVENHVTTNDEWLNEMISFPCDTWNPKIRKKRIKTTIEKYGVDHIHKLPEMKEKVKQTNIEKYGGHPLTIPEILEKSKQTNMRKYGVDNYSKSKEYNEKCIKTNQKKYGYNYYNQTPEFRENSKQTYMKRHGVHTNMKTEEFKIKSQQTCLEKFGYAIPQQSPIIQEKIKQTNLERYGIGNVLATKENQQKRKDLMMKKFGVTNSSLLQFKCDDTTDLGLKCGFEGNGQKINNHFKKTGHTKKLVLLANDEWKMWEKVKTNKCYIPKNKRRTNGAFS